MINFKQVTKNISNDYDFDWDYLEEELTERALDILKEKNIESKSLELWYDLSYNQWSWVCFIKWELTYKNYIFHIYHSNRYTHERSFILECEWDEEIDLETELC